MSNIAWTDRTWNPVIGCTPVSPGCLNCYAATMARRLEAMGKNDYRKVDRPDIGHDAEGPAPVSIAVRMNGRDVFTGSVRCLPDRLTYPLKWRKPCRIFVNSMSDLFHEAVPFWFIDHVFTVMAITPRHTYQVLTKRPERMAEYLTDATLPGRIYRVLSDWLDQGEQGFLGRSWDEAHDVTGCRINGDPTEPEWNMPLPNVWLGTSVENQATAEERIPHLLRCPAAVRFLSVEPLLEWVELDGIWGYPGSADCAELERIRSRIGWIIVGGESGPHARPCNVEWIRSIVGQCKAAGVPVFVKQLGENVEDRNDRGFEAEVETWADGPNAGRPTDPQAWPTPLDVECEHCTYQGEEVRVRLCDRSGSDPAEWPEDLRVRQWPEVGK